MKICLSVVCLTLLSMFSSLSLYGQSCQLNVGAGQPTGIAIDSSGNAWVAFTAGNYVDEIAATNCSLLRQIPVGNSPIGVAFDGTNIWVGNYGSNSVSVISPASGTVIATYAVGANPRGVVFDGTYIWVANYSGNTVTKFQPSNGAVLGNFAVGTRPWFMGVDTTNSTIWVASGAVLKSVNVSGHGGPEGLAWDPADGLIRGVTWGGYTYTINPSTYAVSFSFFGGKNLYDIVYDPNTRFVWVSEIQAGIVSQTL